MRGPSRGRLRLLVVSALALLVALVALRGLAQRLEERVVATLEREAARHGAQARIEGVRVSLLPPLHLTGVVIGKAGQWEARCESLSVRLRPWGRTGFGLFGLATLGATSLSLPAGLELQLNPSAWEVSSEGWAELRAPTEGLVLRTVTEPSGRRLEVEASGLATADLGRLLLEGAASPGLGVVDGEARLEDREGQAFEAQWRIAAIGAESRGRAALGSGDRRLELSLEIEHLDFARLFNALGVEPPGGSEALGSLKAAVGVSGPLAEPESLAVSQRLEFTPPARLPPALLRLKGDFAHEVAAPTARGR